jgi:hypothetical protein
LVTASNSEDSSALALKYSLFFTYSRTCYYHHHHHKNYIQLLRN